ncbi:MAG: TRAP transporter small permease [Proteobacteria bacterium]|nr:TRAP transporter small permease [Pseudomonadota bacterium]
MRRRIDAFETGFNQVTFFLAALVAISIGLIALLIPLNLLLTRMQWGNIWWLYEAVEYALYVGVFIGAPWVLHNGAHVRVDVIVAALPRRQAIRLEQGVDMAGALLCLLLCVYGARATLSEFADGTLPDKDLRIANWYMLAVFAGSFFLLAIEFLLRMRRAAETADTGTVPTSSGF